MSALKISRKLHLVIPVTRERDNAQLYIHSTPISAETFDLYWSVIGKAFAQIYGGGYGIASGPRIAHKMLRDIAKADGVWDGPLGVERGLVGEIHRLTNVLVPAQKGAWDLMPFDDALQTKQIDATDVDQIEAALVFCTLATSMHRREDLPTILEGVTNFWGARTESLPCTEFLNSLRTSITDASSGAKAAA